MSGPLHLNLLGGFEARLPDQRLLRISTRKNQALLAVLAVESGWMQREALTELLWSDRAHAQARDSLRQSLVALRRDLEAVLPAPLRIENEVVMLDPDAVVIDVQEFVRHAGSQTTDDLRRAIELYRGDLLAGSAVRDPAFDRWLSGARRRFHELAVAALERLIPTLDGAVAVDAARRLVRLDPLREGGQRSLIRAYMRQGESELGVRQARDYRALLQRERGASPSPEFEREIADLARTANGAAAGAPAAVAPRYEKPVIAVLPFESRHVDPEARFLAAAFTDDIVTAMSRAAAFRVAARSSAQTYVGPAGDFRKLALELAADYVLEGGVQQSGTRARIHARLIDAAAGHHIWADRYECAVADWMEVQDRLARTVAASIETQIYLARRDAAGRSEGPAGAQDLVLRCRGLLYDMTVESFVEATRLAEQATALEPRNGAAHLILAEAHLHPLSLGLVAHDADQVQRGIDLAQAALGLNPEDEWAHAFMAEALSEAGRLAEALGEAERALEINPSLSVAVGRLGELHALMGRPETAVEHCRLALQLNPRDPTSFWWRSSLALAHFVAGDHEAMLHEARRVQGWRPDFLRGPLLMAAALAALDRPEEAGSAIAAAREVRPDLALENVVPHFLPRFARDDDHRKLLELLRAAGLPET